MAAGGAGSFLIFFGRLAFILLAFEKHFLSGRNKTFWAKTAIKENLSLCISGVRLCCWRSAVLAQMKQQKCSRCRKRKKTLCQLINLQLGPDKKARNRAQASQQLGTECLFRFKTFNSYNFHKLLRTGNAIGLSICFCVWVVGCGLCG